METTENNATDANSQSNDFTNDLYAKLESDISFEDALKNNNSNADQEIPYLDIQSPHFDKEAASSQNEVSADTFELNNASRNSEITQQSTVEEITVVETENQALVDEILGETSQPLDENIEPETEERLLADSEEEISLAQNISEEQKGNVEEIQGSEIITEDSKTAPQLDESITEDSKIVEEIVVEEVEQEQQNPPDVVEDVQYVIEEPNSDSNTRKGDIEIRETETITIEEISTDGSITSVVNQPVIVVPDEKQEGEENEENVQTVETETEKKSEVGTSAVEESVVIEVDGEKLVEEEAANVAADATVLNEEEKPMETAADEEKTEIEKQIAEASIIIDDSDRKLDEIPVVLAQNPDNSSAEGFIVIEGTELLAAHNDGEEQKKQKKPSSCLEKMKIPHHVLGTNIEKPVRDLCSNGRVPPKPRLGVKIPYRNLTSQIVSKQEIEKVILDRARAKQQQPPAGGDLFFTKRLTQRLARKIIPEEKRKAAELEQQKKKEMETVEQATGGVKPAQDADLLAILEGDADDLADVPLAERGKSKDESAEMKEWRRDVALKQLEQMPPRRRGRSAGLDQAIYKRSDTATPNKPPLSDGAKGGKPSGIPVLQKVTVEEDLTQNSDNVADEVDMEPRFSTNSVVKTYTRKRKPAENVTTLAKSVDVEASPKKPLKTVNEQKQEKVSIDLPPNAYVTKSSRVIKRKVIWDPDEAASPIRSYKAPKTESPPKQELVATPVKTVEKKLSVKVVHKTIDEKVTADDKMKSATKKLHKVSLLKKPKRLTEVDRLLMDEGAVNMLYDVKTTEDQNLGKQKKRNQSTISLDKAQKELLNKTNEIKNDLQIYSTRESPKSLRKKDGISITPPQIIKKEVAQPGQITRKKSKDSNRSSVHSPPASPAYVFPQHAEASRIIRRHSSSSFSSGDEAPEKQSDNEEVNTVKSIVKKKATSTEQKLVKKSKTEKESLSASEKSKLNEEMAKSFNELTEKNDTKPAKYGEFKTLSVKTEDKMVHITMNVGRKDAFLNAPILNELTTILNQIKNDSSCNAVLLTSAQKSFCQGLDYKHLVADTEEQRKKKATTLANAVKEFLQTLAAFPKFIAAAVDGAIVGMGITMLPLFDMVLSSDKATFSAPYCRLGCAAEGGSLLNSPHVASCTLASELLYACQKIVAEDAAKHGLITRIVWADNFYEEVLNTIIAISNQSQQALEAVKKQLRQPLLASINKSVEGDVDVLVEQWISAECQKNFGKYKLDKE